MKLSLAWIGEYVELPATPLVAADRVAQLLTGAGLAVEQIERRADDAVLDVDITTNRPDCMNHLGIARELSVLLDRPLTRPAVDLAEGTQPIAGAARVEIEDPVGCRRFVARVVRGVRIGESPDWLKRRLASIGLRSINNVVDVTNFVLWETGQPLHAYDLAKLAEARLVVRRARAEERLVTLDGTERPLDPEVLVISDAGRPVGIAGVMGGLESEVTAATVDILLESAHFDRKAVRTAAKKLGLKTDASHRFERGADIEACRTAADRAVSLILGMAGGMVLSGAIDLRPAEIASREGTLDMDRLTAFAGAEIEARDAERWLAGLGFQPVAQPLADRASFRVAVPSWRFFDFEPRKSSTEIYPADLYEEVLRIHGFDAIPAALPAIAGSDGPPTPSQRRRTALRDTLAAAGYAEAIHFAFHDPKADATYPSLRPEAKPLELANPLSERYSVMRRSLVPNLVASARFNQRRGAAAVRLFEVATVFFERPEAPLPDQPEHLGMVCGGRLGSPWEREADLDFFDLKGAIENLAKVLDIELEARPASLPGLAPGSAAELYRIDDPRTVVGYLGRVAEEEGYPLYVAELATAALAGPGEGGASVAPVSSPSRFPSIAADFTLTHAATAAWSELRAAIEQSSPSDLVSFALRDRYFGPGVPEGAVNSTISFVYNAGERSLTQDEVNERQLALNALLTHRFGWRT